MTVFGGLDGFGGSGKHLALLLLVLLTVLTVLAVSVVVAVSVVTATPLKPLNPPFPTWHKKTGTTRKAQQERFSTPQFPDCISTILNDEEQDLPRLSKNMCTQMCFILETCW